MLYCLLICIVIGYLVGSISTSLIISKLFFKIDLREYGSKNAGGTNAGRVLGKKVGIIVIFLDAIKVGLTILFTYLLTLAFQIPIESFDGSIILYSSIFMTTFGHCYPIYFNFKGGKAVSTLFGILLFTNYQLALLFLLVYGLVLFTTKYVSLSSITASIVVAILSFINIFRTGTIIPCDYLNVYSVMLCFISMLLIFKHRSNIVRLVKGVELEARWIVRIHNKLKAKK